MLFLAPGTAPRSMSRFRSGSTRTTFRFLTVTGVLPILPGILRPLKVRPGLLFEPMDPGVRWLLHP